MPVDYRRLSAIALRTAERAEAMLATARSARSRAAWAFRASAARERAARFAALA